MKGIMIIAILLIIALNMTDFLAKKGASAIPEEYSELPQAIFCPESNCSKALVKLIENSTRLRCAIYDLEDSSIIASMASHPDAAVIIEEQNLHHLIIKGSHAGLRIFADQNRQLQHNKFCVFDSEIVWTGSFNPTDNGNLRNNENVIIIHSRYIAESFEDEWNEMMQGKYGRGEEVRHSHIMLNRNLIESYFCPEDHCSQIVRLHIGRAKESIYFMQFSFTDSMIAKMLVDRQRHGVEVEGIVEKSRITMKYEMFHYLTANGIHVFPDANPYVMHHKVFIIDEETVMTGSYNPTQNADTQNDENLLVVHDSRIAGEYMAEYRRLMPYENVTSA